MHDEMEANRRVARAGGKPPAPMREQPWRQQWIARNERFLRTVFMVCAYVFAALCLVSVFALGAFAFVSGVLAGIVLISVLAVLVLLKFRRKRTPGAEATL